jgi:hypothetical protein
MIYFYAARHSAFLILYVYAKGEQEDLRPDQKRALKAVLEPYR